MLPRLNFPSKIGIRAEAGMVSCSKSGRHAVASAAPWYARRRGMVAGARQLIAECV
jgi:hypothetical protein